MKKFTIAITLIASLLSGCAVSHSQTEKYATVAQEHQMVERDQSNFDYVLERSHDRQAGIQKVFIAELGFNEVKIDEGFQVHRLRREAWALNEKDISGFQDMFAHAMGVYFVEKNGFVVVSEPEEADLIIAADIKRIAPNAPKDDHKSREIGVKYYSEGSGSMTVVIDVYKNNKLVMKIEDARDAGQLWERNTKFSNRQNTKQLFKTWAKNLTEVI